MQHIADRDDYRSFTRAVHQPGCAHLADHIGALIRGPIGAQRNGDPGAYHRRYRCDSAAKAAVALGAMCNAGARLTESSNFSLTHVHQVSEPDVQGLMPGITSKECRFEFM
jgi:hypothetical protein